MLEMCAHAKPGGNSGDLSKKPSLSFSYVNPMLGHCASSERPCQSRNNGRALFDFGKSVWLRPKTACEVVQYCKNCLLVSIHCLFPPDFAWDESLFSWAMNERKLMQLMEKKRHGREGVTIRAIRVRGIS